MNQSITPSIACWGSLRRSVGRKVRWSALALTLAAASQLQADPPELKTLGNQIVVKGTNERVRLVGANFTGLEKDSGYDRNFLNSLDILKGTWKANIIRLAVSDGLWFQTNTTARDAYRAKVNSIIDRAGALDIYVILDLHKYQQALPSATTFWIDAANTYKTRSHVLFGLLNEPHGTTWQIWNEGDSNGPGMQTLLTTVRNQGANNIVLVGGLDYAYDLRGVLPGYAGRANGWAIQDTASGNGVVYDCHVYPWKDEIQLRAGNAALVHPVLLGEFGHPSGTTVDFLPGKTFEAYTTWMPRMMDWINTNNLHWVGWNFSDGSHPAMLSDWSYAPSPNLGDYALSHMQSYADPTARRVVGGTVIGTPDASGVITNDRSGAVVPFSNTYAYYFNAATASGGWTGLDLGTPTRITQIRYMPAFKLSTGPADMVLGVFQGSNTADFSSAVTLHTINTAPSGAYSGNIGTYTTAAVSDTTAYRYVRYMGPPGKYCHVASVKFYTGDDSGPGVNDDVIIIDNGGTGSTVVGTWSNANDYGFHGSRWVSDGATGKGSASITYRPTIMKAGLYEVFTIWSSHPTSRYDKVPYTITHAGTPATTLVEVDQRTPGETWQSLGTYSFAAGTTGNVVISNTGTTSYVTADAVKFVYKPEIVAPIFMDKASTDGLGITSSTGWSATTTPTPYGNIYSYHDGNTHTGKWVRFTPPIVTPGQYKVSVWWTQHANRATNTPITVYHTSGSTPYTVNQEVNGGQWNELPGTFTFAAGSNPATGSVLITNEGANEYVIVDAVRFVKVN
jgi:hypothetical protein